jgi:predicted Zn-dependent protease with MMP-like domain
MDRERFEELVVRALNDLPEEFRERLENIDVVVEDVPSSEQLQHTRTGHGQILLGLYEGVPHTRRNTYYGMVTPDKISVFQKNIEARSRSETDIILEIGQVVRHEIAHHFGINDARLRELQLGED